MYVCVQVINTSTVCLMGHERRLTLSLIADMARTLFERHALATPTATLFDQSAVELVIDQVYYGPFCCPPVFYPGSNYAVYTYEYGAGSAHSPPPCCDVTAVTSSSTSSSSAPASPSSSCCPYCDTCPQCVAASSEL